ncbi:MAG: cation:proton antiporter [Lachnospiraceae bacterium]|jgi:Kef-type K+ transport system membrane component KefB|nr:cation:proton antiporter [uncultured Ligilactobacillus sp.]MCI8642593.1 cation:proton antiporter [Lachnospiraceae bacterium]MCX4345719.1 cation:proton antiporter [Lachnospiraceae bacterium]
MEAYDVFKDLAIIILVAKAFGILARRCKAPQVVGEIIAGLIIGPSILGWVAQTDFLVQMAEIGVILLMFSAGLETDIKELLRTGPIALLIACAGVFVPLICGTLLYMGFYGAAPWGSEEFYKAVFIGTILTATSVSITVESLREMGRLKGKVGTTILSAAIIDDVIGIIVLTVVVGFKSPDSNPGKVVINTLLFFVLAVVAGFLFYFLFRKFDTLYPHTRRIPILGLAFCFAMSYIAERYFGIADITGAYVAGIVLCSLRDSGYIAQKMDTNSYMLFGPVFFASIGLKTNIDNLDGSILLFAAAFVAVGLIAKIIGCGLAARLCKFKNKDALKIGVGMMTRGEVALIVAQKGLSVGLMTPVYFTAVILLIIVSSILTPIILKVLYAGEPLEEAAAAK